MKNLRTSVLCAAIVLCSLVASAQNRPPVNEPDLSKPKLFTNLPDRIPVNADELAGLFSAPNGRPANLRMPLDATTKFEGEVVSISEKNAEGQQSLVVRSTNFNGARLTLSRSVLADGSVSYSGRILSFQHGDMYELQQQQGQLVLVKRNFYDVVNE